MSLSILHFSDIHLKNGDNKIMARVEKLKRACASAIPYGNDVVILISGDIAFSGKEDEYSIASVLINSVSDYLVEQIGANIHFCFVPGNHDCNFASPNSVRDLLVENVTVATIDNAIYDQMSSVQAAYYSFCEG